MVCGGPLTSHFHPLCPLLLRSFITEAQATRHVFSVNPSCCCATGTNNADHPRPPYGGSGSRRRYVIESRPNSKTVKKKSERSKKKVSANVSLEGISSCHQRSETQLPILWSKSICRGHVYFLIHCRYQ